MTDHLLLLTIGPVQDFIAQARRTRDLWHGSHLLSELSRVAARALAEAGAKLVFPALEFGDGELEPCPGPLRSGTGKPPAIIANKILAEIPARLEPKALARAARSAVQGFWRDDIAATVRNNCRGLLHSNIDNAWDEQIESLLEFTASWTPLDSYPEARGIVERAVASRKTLRDFHPWTQQRGDVAKSSLDGGRETVLAAPHGRSKNLVDKYRISSGEELDAIGLVKRAGGDPDQFVPIVNIALASWCAEAEEIAPTGLKRLRQAASDLGVSRIARTDLPGVKPFPLDASVILENRLPSLLKECGIVPPVDPHDWYRRNVAPLHKEIGRPFPYVACLVADGDGMGALIDSIKTPDEHRSFSSRLDAFARRARGVVERHLGSLVYAGGDEILAFLPLPEAVACAEDLRKDFEGSLSSSLSIGLGVGHVMESMGDLLSLGREAERLAKGAHLPAERRRKALAIVLAKRSGGRFDWRARWETDPLARFTSAVTTIFDFLPSRKIYEIARIVRSLPLPAANASDRGWAHLLALEVQRSLSRRYSGEVKVQPQTVGLHLEHGVDYGHVHALIDDWVKLMLIARNFAEASPEKKMEPAPCPI